MCKPSPTGMSWKLNETIYADCLANTAWEKMVAVDMAYFLSFSDLLHYSRHRNEIANQNSMVNRYNETRWLDFFTNLKICACEDKPPQPQDRRGISMCLEDGGEKQRQSTMDLFGNAIDTGRAYPTQEWMNAKGALDGGWGTGEIQCIGAFFQDRAPFQERILHWEENVYDVTKTEQNRPNRDKGKKFQIKVGEENRTRSSQKQQKRELSEVRAATLNQASTISEN